MKIVIATGIFPPDIGGPASYVPRLAGALTKRGHAVDVVTLADGVISEGAENFSFAVHRIARGMARAKRMVRTIGTIARLGADADVVLANGLYLETALATRRAGTPSVAKVVGDTIWERARLAGRGETLDEFQTGPLPLRWRVLRGVQNRWIGSYAHVFTPSEYLKRIVIGWNVAPEQVSVVYNAVPPVPSPLAGSTGGRPQFDIAAAGRLVPWKGFSALLRVASRRGWSVRVIGDGPLRGELEQLASNGNTVVHFDGHLPQAAVPDAIRSARVFVLNSSYEGLPHIVLEAMGAGVPVIASAAGGTPETIVDGETGLLIPVGEDVALETALDRLLGDSALRDAMAAKATARLAERFSFERMIDDTEALLGRVAKRDAE
jgi:glycosyltransferase involved in cell wall biosynthesis